MYGMMTARERPGSGGKAAVVMKKLAGVLLAAVLATLPAQALEPVIQPLADSGYTYYAIDSHGELYAWGDSFHGAVGPTDQDPLPWEEANILLENARYVAAGFIMAAAIDTEGVLWGWGGYAGRTFGEGEPYRLLEDVAEVSVGDTRCTALRTDGTAWVWGARYGKSLEVHREDPFFRPTQVLDHVVQVYGDLAVLEDGTLVYYEFDGDTASVTPLMEHVAAAGGLYDDINDPAILVQGEDGSLWRVPWQSAGETSGASSRMLLGQPEKLLEDVVQFTGGTAVTADGTLWAWGQNRPAMLDQGAVDPADPYDPEDCQDMVPIMEGVRWARETGSRTLVILEDGTLWEIPSARRIQMLEEGSPLSVLTQPRQLLSQALLPDDPPAWPEEASAPTVLESASLAAQEDGGSAEPQPEQAEASPDPVSDTAPESALAGAWLPAVAAVALALIAWLRGRKH